MSHTIKTTATATTATIFCPSQVKPFLSVLAHNLPFPADAVSHETLVERRKEDERLERANLNRYTFKYLVQNNMMGCHSWVKNIDKIYFGKYT